MSAEVFAALDEVRRVLADEERPEADFYPAADRLLRALHDFLDGAGLEPPPLNAWDPRRELAQLEGYLVDLAAAAKAVHDALDEAGRELAGSN